MKNFTSYLKTWLLIPIGLLVMATIGIGTASSGCRVYKFRDYALPDTIKTVKINFFDNKARYVNPQLSPRLTDRLRQKIVSQTRLSQTNNDNADWRFSGFFIRFFNGQWLSRFDLFHGFLHFFIRNDRHRLHNRD